MGNRSRARELALQVLYQVEVGKQELQDAFNRFLANEKGLPQVKDFARQLAEGVLAHQEEIDAQLSKHSQNWEIQRFPAVDRAILRLGCYELLFSGEIPYEVSLDEYVELAKEYGGDDSPKFVNGLLDQVRKANPRQKTEPSKRQA
jgi:N utilization substance protein B